MAVGIISAVSAVGSYAAGVASYIGYTKITIASIGILSYYSENFRSLSTNIVTGVGSVTG